MGPLALIPGVSISEGMEGMAVAAFVVQSSTWNGPALHAVLPPHVVDNILSVPPPVIGEGADLVYWEQTASGDVSVRAAYQQVAPPTPDLGRRQLWNSIWKWRGLPRAKGFLWQCAHDAISTNAFRVRRHLASDASWFMDIEPLWALGGWFLLSNCMAATTTTKTQAATQPILTTYTKSSSSPHHFLLLFLAVLFIFLLLASPSPNPMRPYNTAASISIKRLLLESSSSSESAASRTMNLHPRETQNFHTSSSSASPSRSSSRAKFGVDKHEVPSGPNPISN
ncbi:hypothetical protein Tsubulata_026586 [Turnera subulata]|uniref:Reverse transcriptase zinc-binding domain-containing protein n=1 Tax=Turnera subulata TaxID=218843 RepID=A0A9Q0JHX0_9ROSI|nr:hypothetical protein Tsubulata_026586 [Turnera subulata]